MATYHRIENSRTQTETIAAEQQRTGEIWGRPGFGSSQPAVKAFVGPLPSGVRGIEFETDIPHDRDTPPGRTQWTGPRSGVRVEGDFAKIRVRVTKNTQV
jgi:hypothetical protein